MGVGLCNGDIKCTLIIYFIDATMKALLILLLVASVNACGNPSYPPFSTRVVNGVDAKPYSWPWQISLEVGRGSYYSHTCGGSLIGRDWVVTAGHCIQSGRSYRVVLGEYDRAALEGGEETIAAAKIFVHPQWNPSCLSCGNDIALIKLSKPATLNDKVKPACIPPSGDIFANDYPCYVTGWGRLYRGLRWLGLQHSAETHGLHPSICLQFLDRFDNG
ncbi:hypothetical protein scyTo_0015048 [Scyliorhinus torazame]|uniref:Peptidase S1 domain-containing protein n=1 Tax=Scyliorhinus torazame TaxID=75743 RepID=A0A401P137_SCYTO|nr:hypothetical protein [Scyliorhinus torazame]